MPSALSFRTIWLLIFAGAALIWSVHITRKVDLPNWHESDYASIARNFLREGSNILYPRIDWRGDGPGYTEMELPVVPWLAAQIYRVTGVNDTVTRVISLASMLAGLVFFSKLARRLLPEAGAMAAGLFYAVNHLTVMVASAHQPEALMQALMMGSVYYFVDWYEDKSRFSYLASMVAFSGAMLLKLPMAHLGLFFLLWALHQEGIAALRRSSLYLFAGLASLPPVLWYMHAATFWRLFHNSSGISDQYHWIGFDLLQRPKVILNFFAIEVLLAGALGGALIALLVVYWNRLRWPVVQLAVRWLIPVAIYFAVILRTSASYWAVYYHLVVVAPLALLFGAGIEAVRRKQPPSMQVVLLICGLMSIVLGVSLFFGSRLNVTRLPGVFQDLLRYHSAPFILASLCLAAFVLTAFCFKVRDSDAGFQMPRNDVSRLLMVAGCFTYFFISGQLLMVQWKAYGTPSAEYLGSRVLAAKVPAGSRVVASGGVCSDPDGHPVASKASDVFYWLDVKGFSTCQGQESVFQLRSYAARGAQFFIADTTSLRLEPQFEQELSNSFRLLASSQTTKLYSLKPVRVPLVP